MRKLEHVRFKLSELISGMQAMGFFDRRPKPSEALGAYWNAVMPRGWKLEGMSARTLVGDVLLTDEPGNQVKIQWDEQWDVVLSGEDTVGSPQINEVL